MTNETLTTLDIMLEVQIEGTPEVVWQALVERTAEWWHADFYTRPGCDRFIIEEKLGGHVFEDWGDGNGLIWGTVIGLESGKLLHVAGDSAREWGGPSRGFLKWTLEGSGNGTLVRFEQCAFGNVSAATRASLEDGWKLLIGECLKAFVEDGAKR